MCCSAGAATHRAGRAEGAASLAVTISESGTTQLPASPRGEKGKETRPRSPGSRLGQASAPPTAPPVSYWSQQSSGKSSEEGLQDFSHPPYRERGTGAHGRSTRPLLSPLPTQPSFLILEHCTKQLAICSATLLPRYFPVLIHQGSQHAEPSCNPVLVSGFLCLCLGILMIC